MNTPASAAVLSSATAPGLWSPQHRALSIGSLLLIAQMAFEYIAVATAMPTVAAALDGLHLYALAFGAPLAAAVVGTVAAGRWSDRHGPHRPLWGGVALFVAGLLLAGLARSMETLVLGRVLQGFGSGVFSVALYVVVGRAYPSELHPRVFAAFAGAWVLPSLIGPSVAGLLVEMVGWRWVFLLPAMLALPSALLMLPGLQDVRAPKASSSGDDSRRIHWALLAACGAALLHVAGQWHGIAAWLLLAVALVAVLVAVRHLLPAGTLSLARGLPAVVAMRGLAAAAFFGAEVFVPLMMTTERGLSPAWAGAALTIGALGWSAGSWYEGRRNANVAAKARALRGGMALMVGGIASQALVLLPAMPLAVGVAGWGLAGLGMGRVYPVLSVLTLELSPAESHGTNSSALQLADAVASAAVLALGGALLAPHSQGGAAVGPMTYLACFAAAVGVAVLGAMGASRVSAGRGIKA